jgi:hypothetical protein
MAKNSLLRSVLSALQQADHYHLAKHIRNHRPDQLASLGYDEHLPCPSWIKVHRMFAVHLRQSRRSLLAALGIRGRDGRVSSEAFAEAAVRQELDQAA